MSCFRWFAVVIGQSFGLSAPLWVTFLCSLLGLTSIKTSCFSPLSRSSLQPTFCLSQGGGGRRLLGLYPFPFFGDLCTFARFSIFYPLSRSSLRPTFHLSQGGGEDDFWYYPFPSLGFVHFLCYQCHSLFFFAFVKQTLTSNVNFHSIN